MRRLPTPLGVGTPGLGTPVLEDTTCHTAGMNQGAKDGALPLNEPLEIPIDVCTQADAEPNYLKAPEIRLKAMRFETFDFQPDKELLKKYELHDLTWFFACCAHRERTSGDSDSVLEPEKFINIHVKCYM